MKIHNIIQRFLKLFVLEHKRSFIFLVFIICLTALLEVLSLVSLLPFLNALTGSENSEQMVDHYYIKIGILLNINNIDLLKGYTAFIFLWLAAIAKSYNFYNVVRYTQAMRYDLSIKLLDQYFNETGLVISERSKSGIIKNISTEIDLLIDRGVTPLLQSLSNGLMLFSLVLMVLSVKPMVGISAILTLSVAYILIYYFVRRSVARAANSRLASNETRFKILKQIVDNLRYVYVSNTYPHFRNNFEKFTLDVTRKIAITQVLGQIPRFLVEAVAIGGIIAYAVFQLTQPQLSTSSILPVLGFLAITGYRMLPLVQALYQSATNIRFVIPTLDLIEKELSARDRHDIILKDNDSSVGVFRSLDLNKIKYAHKATVLNEKGEKLVFGSLEVVKGDFVCIIGESGSGKSTLLDIILGFLEPAQGNVYVNGINLNSGNIGSWHSQIGYVPQDIALMSGTIASNVAFGEKSPSKFTAKVNEILEQVGIDLSRMNAGSQVGEGGHNLSGGQRQRIAIARALYHKPRVLILDEPTSSLDDKNSRLIVKLLTKLQDQLTIIVVTHQPEYFPKDTTFLKIDNGQIINIKNDC